MLSIADDFADYQFVIAGAPSQEYSFYEQFLTNKNVKLVQKPELISEILKSNKKIIVTIGAGDIGEMVSGIKEALLSR